MNILSVNYLTRGFWGDEAWTALISQLPLAEILRVTGEDFHPPFYYFIVHFWGGFFGFGEVTLRLISLLFFLLTPIVVFVLAQKFFKNTLQSLFTAILVLLSPILFTYAFEARSYALLAFLSVSSAFSLWLARTEKGYFWRIAYFFLGAISVYTHYYSWFILASHGLYLLIFERKYFLKLLPPAIGILLVQLPWIPVLLSQIGEVSRDYWIAPINAYTHWEFFLRVAGGDHVTVLQLPSALIILVLTFFGIFFSTASSKKNKFTPELKFLLCWIIIPTLIPTLISFKTPVFFYRYLIFSAIPLILLTVSGLWRLPQKHLLPLSVLLLISYGYINFQSFKRHPRSMREEKEIIYQTKTPGDSPIYTVLPSFAEVTYYFNQNEDIKVIPEGLVQFSGKSLLDSFVRSGEVEIIEPPQLSSYWLLEPGPKSTHIQPE